MPSVVGGYRLLERIGGGGMGEVYRAVHEKLGRTVAVKFLRPGSGASVDAARFLNEARIQAALEHPNIATLHDFLEVEGVACIVMEYVPGPTLGERLAQEGPIPCDEALRILEQILDAVGFIHRNGIVHRDLKSGNVKIDPAGRVKLLDFGISRQVSSPRMTREGAVIGTPGYLAPEQLRGGSPDERADVWALGVLLHEMVTGTLPRDGIATRVRSDVDAIVARCLQAEPERRYPSVAAMAEAVRCAGDPRHEISWRWPRPRRGVVFAAGGGALLIAAAAMLAFALRGTGAGPGGTPVRFLVDSQPAGAEVYDGGDYVGRTPCSLERPVGERLELVLRKDGFAEKRQSVLVGAHMRAVTVSLDREP